MLNLKIAAVETLSYSEFLNFFGGRKASARFDHGLYLKIKSKLRKETCSFFDKLYKEFDCDGFKLVTSNYFKQRDDLVKVGTKVINSYLSAARSYTKIKKIIESKKPSFIRSDVKDIFLNPELKRKKFDLINLSNVPNYVTRTTDSPDPVEEFYNQVLVPMKRILSPKGKIFFISYSDTVYPTRIARKIPPISTAKGFDKLRGHKEFLVSKVEFDGLKPGTKDRITILENR